MTEGDAKRATPQRVVRELQKRKRTLPRWERAYATYHVRASVLPERSQRLTDPALGRILCETLHHDDGRRYILHCYVVMPDHFHAIVHPSRREDGSVPLTEIMKIIKGVSARRINEARGLSGSFWREESYTRIIRCEAEYRETWHYIRCNPVKAGLVERPEEWEWWWSRE